MNKEFIPYKQALVLKELGFNEPCLAKYTSDKLLLNIDWNKIWCENISEFEIYTPLYQQAFRWFREKHGLYSHVRESLAFDKTLEFVTQINGSYVNHDISDKPVNRYETYEEAELACLKKLIEIVKEKQ
jgi:hypothetical protein